MQFYVVGFLFNSLGDEVVLIKKNRPAWQKGCLNGVGGKVEEGEVPHAGMVREFFEETGVQFNEWEFFASIEGTSGPRDHVEAWKIFFYRGFDSLALDKTATTTDEVIVRESVTRIPMLRTVAHLRWLVPMALYTKEVYEMKEVS